MSSTDAEQQMRPNTGVKHGSEMYTQQKHMEHWRLRLALPQLLLLLSFHRERRLTKAAYARMVNHETRSTEITWCTALRGISKDISNDKSSH